jgi:hypothetical protein
LVEIGSVVTAQFCARRQTNQAGANGQSKHGELQLEATQHHSIVTTRSRCDVRRGGFVGGRSIWSPSRDSATSAMTATGRPQQQKPRPPVSFKLASHACRLQRIFVHTDIAAAFREALVAGVAELTVGHPLSEDVDVSAVSRKDALRIESWATDAVATGARIESVANGSTTPRPC